jgi:histidine triad (HIT) family protein
MASDCVFCRVVAGSLPAHLVYDDDECVAFLDHRPAARGHTLVVPRAHVDGLWDAAPETAAAVMRTAADVAALLRERLQPDGLTLRQNTGKASGQDVFHLHLHLVPRWYGDGSIGWPRPPDSAIDLGALLDEIRSGGRS